MPMSIAVIGARLAGMWCLHALLQAGHHTVPVFDGWALAAQMRPG